MTVGVLWYHHDHVFDCSKIEDQQGSYLLAKMKELNMCYHNRNWKNGASKYTIKYRSINSSKGSASATTFYRPNLFITVTCYPGMASFFFLFLKDFTQ